MAETSPIKANGVIGTYTVNATINGFAPLIFNFQNLIGDPSYFSVTSGGSQSTVVNTIFALPIQVVLKDAGGNPLANYNVAFSTPNTNTGTTKIQSYQKVNTFLLSVLNTYQ